MAHKRHTHTEARHTLIPLMSRVTFHDGCALSVSVSQPSPPVLFHHLVARMRYRDVLKFLSSDSGYCQQHVCSSRINLRRLIPIAPAFTVSFDWLSTGIASMNGPFLGQIQGVRGLHHKRQYITTHQGGPNPKACMSVPSCIDMGETSQWRYCHPRACCMHAC